MWKEKKSNLWWIKLENTNKKGFSILNLKFWSIYFDQIER